MSTTTTTGTETTTMEKRKQFTIERTFAAASIDDVWDLWTTKDGIESWWGPEGFEVKVKELDLRVGGELVYQMIAVAPQMVEFMKKSGMPLSSDTRLTYTEIVLKQRLACRNHIDFIPNVEAYDNGTLVELFPSGQGVRMVLTVDAMHNEEWTNRAVGGWEQEVGKLEKLLAARHTKNN